MDYRKLEMMLTGLTFGELILSKNIVSNFNMDELNHLENMMDDIIETPKENYDLPNGDFYIMFKDLVIVFNQKYNPIALLIPSSPLNNEFVFDNILILPSRESIICYNILTKNITESYLN